MTDAACYRVTTLAAMTKRQRAAVRLLATGGARYGTMLTEMRQLRDMGLAQAWDTGKVLPGRWTWRPTDMLRAMLTDAGRAALG